MFDGHQELDPRTAQGTQNISLSTNNSTAITIQTATLCKKVNTTLTGFTFLLTAGIYWLLITYTKKLSNEIILPTKLLLDNICAILSLTWPKTFMRKNSIDRDLRFPWVLFHRDLSEGKAKAKGSSQADSDIYEPVFRMSGFHEIKDDRASAATPGRSTMLSIKAFSPAMKTLIHIAIWNSFSFWLVLITICNTVLYNGFASRNVTNDSAIRMTLVGVYAANFAYQFRITSLLYRNFTLILFQTCWTIICKTFTFLSSKTYYDYLAASRILEYKARTLEAHEKEEERRRLIADNPMDWRSLNLELFGLTERSDTYELLDSTAEIGTEKNSIFEKWPSSEKGGTFVKAQGKAKSKFYKIIKPIHEAEIKAYEKATESVLEKTLANIAVLLGICLATALAPWTSYQGPNSVQGTYATATQLGSYALLLSVSTGTLALVSGITQLSNATDSARTLLLLQERIISASRRDHETGDTSANGSFWVTPELSFTKGIGEQSRLTFCGLWRSMGLRGMLPCLLLGPALTLVPGLYDDVKTGLFTESQILSFTLQDRSSVCLP